MGLKSQLNLGLPRNTAREENMPKRYKTAIDGVSVLLFEAAISINEYCSQWSRTVRQSLLMTFVHNGPVYCSAVLLKLDVSSRPWAKRHLANVWSAKTASLRLKLAQERPDTLFFLI